MSDKKVAGNKGFTIRQKPEEYDMTEQQKKFKIVQERCGIKKGISKAELQLKMKNCIPKEWEKIKGKSLEEIKENGKY